MKYIFLPLILLAFFVVELNGQTYKQYIKAADAEFANKDYYSAMKHYQVAMEIEGESVDVLYKYAESARHFEAYSIADRFYEKTAKADTSGTYGMSLYWLGAVKKKQGDYLSSQQHYQLFVDQFSEKYPDYIAIAKNEIEDLNWAIEAATLIDDNVSVEKMGDHINTKVSDFAPVQIGKDIYFSTQNNFRKVEKGKDPKPFSKVMKTRVGSTDTERVSFNDRKRHTAHTAFNKEKSRVYFTICDYVGETTEIHCQIHYSNIEDLDDFSKPVQLPDYINKAGFTATDPCIGTDESTGESWLYFVSDRTGGEGGFDIWASLIEGDSSFAKPINLSDVNTSGDELTPFFHDSSQTLYFSSNGRLGFGGYDIYKAEKEKESFTKIEHLPVPYNSSYDDSHFWIDKGRIQGYFASKRLGSKVLEPEYEACCYDLYKFGIKVINLDVLTFNKKSRAELDGVKIEIKELTDEGEIDLATATNDEGNDFNFELKRDGKYVIIATKDGFLPVRDTVDLSLPENRSSSALERKLYLLPEEVELNILSFNKKTMNPLKGVEVRLVVNGQEVDFKMNEDGNDVSFILERGKNYQIIGSKVAYFSDTIDIDLRTDITTSLIEEKLLLRPKEIEDFPPLVIYFDNDQPNPRTRKTTTNFTYEETWREYMNKKGTYVSEYVKSLSGFDSLTSTRRMTAFFDREVKNGFLSLDVFSENIHEIMNEGGFKVELVIQGFTSPRASADYNYNLSKRRSDCLKNHFERWRGGVLKPYIDNGQITLEVVGHGEELAPQFISDRLDDERESIYSVQASFERKVAIIGARRVEEN